MHRGNKYWLDQRDIHPLEHPIQSNCPLTLPCRSLTVLPLPTLAWDRSSQKLQVPKHMFPVKASANPLEVKGKEGGIYPSATTAPSLPIPGTFCLAQVVFEDGAQQGKSKKEALELEQICTLTIPHCHIPHPGAGSRRLHYRITGAALACALRPRQ